MPRRTLPYGALSSANPTLRPVLDLNLIGPSKRITPVVGLVDSGADQTTLPLHLAERLGVDLDRDCDSIGSKTAGGTAHAHLVTVKIRAHLPVFDKVIELRPSFMTELDVVLLGRDDFFHHFKVSVHQRTKKFVLTTHD